MARHKTFRRPALSEPDLDISSLIDICFLLLIYFLATSTIVPRERDLAMSLPGKYEGAVLPPIPPLVIRIDSHGAVYSGSGQSEQELDTHAESRDLPLLSGHLDLYRDAARSAGNEAMVMLRVDAGTVQQRVIDVLNALAAAGISAVAFEDLAVL